MKVAILGCGPAGLLAAHAVARAGHEPNVYSHKVKSQMFGAMYLHRAIPGITSDNPELEIRVIKSGTREGYANKVYGDPSAPVSWDLFEPGVVPGWDLAKAYDKLWEMYEHTIVSEDVTPYLADLKTKVYPLVFSTVPLTTLCREPRAMHEFTKQDIWVLHGPGDHLILGVNDNNMMYYSGDDPLGKLSPLIGPTWYRFSQINKYQAWEYASDPQLDPDEVMDGMTISTGIKPLTNNCDCHPEIVRLGRFGKWQKGVLTHHAFEEAQNALLEL
jgi:hypothetical protein